MIFMNMDFYSVVFYVIVLHHRVTEIDGCINLVNNSERYSGRRVISPTERSEEKLHKQVSYEKQPK